MLVDPAPIPPHERSWRHPSELVPTAAAIDDGSPSRRILLAASCAVVATFAVGLVVLALPPRDPAPVAVSATTLPAFTLSSADQAAGGPRGAGADERGQVEQVRLARTAIAAPTGLALTGAPRSVAAPIDGQVDGQVDGTPSRGDRDDATGTTLEAEAVVHLITASHVYRLSALELEWIIAPDGTLVVDDRGRVVGTFVDGRFVAD